MQKTRHLVTLMLVLLGVVVGSSVAQATTLVEHNAIPQAGQRWSADTFSTLLEPITAAILALLIFHESLSAFSLAGGVVLLASIAVFLSEESRSGWRQPSDWIDP